MKFQVYCASNRFTEVQPCDGAYRPLHNCEHEWFINIETLTDLMELIEGLDEEIVINHTKPIPTIKIYDDYIE